MDISKGAIHSQRVRRPCNVPTNQRHGPGHGEVIDIRRCERIAGNPCCQSLLDPGSRGKCHEYATIEVSKRTHPRNSRAFTRRWGVTARDTRTAVASTLQIPRWTVHSKRTRFESAPITLMNQTRQGTRVHARTHARGVVYLWKLSAFPFDCSLPVTDTANCRGPPTIDIHSLVYEFSEFAFFSFYFSLVFIPCELTPWLIHSILLSIPWLFAQREPTNWFTRFIWDRWEGTWPRKTAASRIMFFFLDKLALRSRFRIKREMREKTLWYLEFLNHGLYGLCNIFIPIKSDWSESKSD